MLFNSIEFLIFLPIVFLLYWFLCGKLLGHSRHQLMIQNLLILVASYVFYAWWDWRYLILIIATSFSSWISALAIENTIKTSNKKTWLIINIVLNLAILGVFKYYNFFISSFCYLFGIDNSSLVLQLLLPVGISFYTFQALSYSIDVYRGKLAATKDIISFFSYIAFFPQLVAGPIERATNLLPQFKQKRHFNYQDATEGLQRILWGMFKKVVIADNCAWYVNMEWADYANQNGSTLVLTAILFAMQIYCDFSGYSDIAIGTARLFGFHLCENFKMPYFSRSVAEFWKRWHISLNTWFVDYVYIPLGGSRQGKLRTILNTFVIFLLSGLWHGANWTYVTWGLYHAVLFVPLIVLNKTKNYQDTSTWRHIPQMLITFVLVVVGWIVFRAPTLRDAWLFMYNMVIHMSHGEPFYIYSTFMYRLLAAVLILFSVEWVGRKNACPLAFAGFSVPAWAKWLCYTILVQLIFAWGRFDYTQFIYFQF